MKKLVLFCFTITLLNSCFPRLELNTNYYSLEICHDTILNPSYCIPKKDSIITDLYLTDSTIIMTYNNKYRRIIKPSKIKFMSSRIMFYINDYIEYEISEINGNLYFSKWDYWYKMIPKSSTSILDNDYPTYNQIQSYLKNYEIKGDVEAVKMYTYESKKMFGKDTLLSKNKYDYSYNDKGSVIYYGRYDYVNSDFKLGERIYYTYNQLNQLTRTEYHEWIVYDNEPNIRYKEYLYNENNQISSIINSPKHDDFIYDDSLRLKEYNEYYSYDGLDRKTIYSYNNNLRKGIIYDGYTGEKIHENQYDSNNSLIKGWDKDYSVNTTTSIENTTVSKQYRYRINEDKYFLSYKTLCKYDKDKNMIYKDETIYNWGKEIKHIYRYSYEYDPKGNWVKRKRVCLFSSDKNEKGQTIIDIREITYYQ